MAQIPITPRHVAPYVIGGATGVHILTRMRRLSKQPASDVPLHFFLLKNGHNSHTVTSDRRNALPR